jgi:hypothetical protein
MEWQDCQPLNVHSEEEVKIAIYPNPSTGLLTVDSRSDDLPIGWTLFDLAGRMVDQGVLPKTATAKISLAVPEGAYLLGISFESGAMTSERIVIQ